MLIRSIGSICTATFRHGHTSGNCRLRGTGVYAKCPRAGEIAGASGQLLASNAARDMARQAAGRHQHGVEADVAQAVVGMLGEPGLGGGDDAALLPLGHRLRRRRRAGARLHLDEDQRAAPARHDVDLADRAAPAPRQDAIALGDRERRRRGSRPKGRAGTRPAARAAGRGVRRRASRSRPFSCHPDRLLPAPARADRRRAAAARSRPRPRRPRP